MPVFDPTPVILLVFGLGLGAFAMWYGSRRFKQLWGRIWRWRKPGQPRHSFREDRVVTQTIAERVRSMGKLVALEVCAKEIATASSGWAWLPPLILSQARIAMIFHFEKQYSIDLARIMPEDVTHLDDGCFRLRLPPMTGQLRLIDMTPYDIQAARVLGLLDLMPMTADRQRELMKRAQQQAASLYETNDERYLTDARVSAERHLRSLTELLGVQVEFEWPEVVEATAAPAPEALAPPRPAPRRFALPVALNGAAG